MRRKMLAAIDRILSIKLLRTMDAAKAEKSMFMYDGETIYYCTLLGAINSVLIRLPGKRVIVKAYENHDGEQKSELIRFELKKKWW